MSISIQTGNSARCFAIAIAVTLAAALTARPAAAQSDSNRPVLSVVGGATQYDLSGTGTEGFFGVRMQLPVTRYVVIEPGVTYFSYRNQGIGGRWNVYLPEVQAQAELRRGNVRPYLGAGVGMSVARIAGTTFNDFTGSAAVGLRVSLPRGFVAGGELRIRSIDPFTGTTADWGLSLGKRL